MANTIILGIIALSLVVLTVFFVLIFCQLKRLTANLENLIESLRKDFAALAAGWGNTAQKISQLSQNLDEKLQQTNELFEAIRNVGYALHPISALIKEGVSCTSIYVKSAAAGFKAALDSLFKSIGKGGGKHGGQ